MTEKSTRTAAVNVFGKLLPQIKDLNQDAIENIETVFEFDRFACNDFNAKPTPLLHREDSNHDDLRQQFRKRNQVSGIIILILINERIQRAKVAKRFETIERKKSGAGQFPRQIQLQVRFSLSLLQSRV